MHSTHHLSMEERRSFLDPAEILRNRHRPLYFLLVKSKPVLTWGLPADANRQGIRDRKGYRARTGTQKSARETKPDRLRLRSRPRRVQQLSDGTWEREEDGFLYLFLHSLDAEFFLDQRERQNRCACNGMRVSIQETLGDGRLE